ncbi:MAG: hypothetical protein PHX82_16800 [Paracoccaceae bacterium]|nr:hypothetical protein [Paracoccaceae bacterium]
MRVIGALPQAVSAEAFRRAVHLIEADPEPEDEVALNATLLAAQMVVERATNRPLGLREVEFSTELPAGARLWWLPCAPVTEVLSLACDMGAGPVALDPGQVALCFAQDEPRLEFAAGTLPAGAGLRLVLRARAGAEVSAPEAVVMRQAIILIAKEWHEAGISIGEGDARAALPRMSFGAQALIRSVRYLAPQMAGWA